MSVYDVFSSIMFLVTVAVGIGAAVFYISSDKDKPRNKPTRIFTDIFLFLVAFLHIADALFQNNFGFFHRIVLGLVGIGVAVFACTLIKRRSQIRNSEELHKEWIEKHDAKKKQDADNLVKAIARFINSHGYAGEAMNIPFDQLDDHLLTIESDILVELQSKMNKNGWNVSQDAARGVLIVSRAIPS